MNPDLSQLRDIHLPEPISWWPPAIGWWLSLLLIIVLCGVVYWFYLSQKKMQWRRDALEELKRLKALDDHRAQLRQLSVLLRRVAITRFPRAEVAALTGKAWLKFLDQPLQEAAFQLQGDVLIAGPYAAQYDADMTALLSLSERWINALPTKGVR